jgi:sugar transferase (PEP-CTERM/EpsH1 system associated)
MKRLLYISHCLPYPPDKGERVRAFHEIQALSSHFRITLAALERGHVDQPAVQALRQWCEEVIVAPAGGASGLARGAVSLFGGGSVTEGYFKSRRLLAAVREAAAREPFDIALGYSSSTLPYLLNVPAGARIMDLVDVDSAKWGAYAASSSWPRSCLYRAEARAVRRLEERAVSVCDAVLLTSPAEVHALSLQSKKVIPVSNGVDSEYFRPAERAAGAPQSLVFTGQMNYRPNVEGVCWFVRQVWSTLRRGWPALTFAIVGRNPAPVVRRLAEVPGVSVTGAVPDIRPYLAAATIAVAPLFIGRGIQNKVLEAMASGLPVVASPMAVEGLDVQVGADLLQADTPEKWVERLGQLLSDEPGRRAMGQAARRIVQDRYIWSARMAPLTAVCNELLGLRRTRPIVAHPRQMPIGT